MRITAILSCALALGAASLCATSAAAQGARAQARAPDEQAAPLQSEDALPEEQPSEEDDESQDPMGWIGIGVKVGFAFVGSSEIGVDAASLGLAPTVEGMQINPTYTFITPRRAGVQLSIPINLGGDGFGWMVEPYFHFASYRANGLYTGPTINLHLADPLYFGFGFGFKGALLYADELDFGIDLGGRIPFTLHYYLANDLGLIAEAGIGYTATGLSLKPAPGKEAGDISFGGAFAWDLSFGVRFP